MKRFEILAKLHGLDVNKNEHNYLNPATVIAYAFWDDQQVIIDDLKHELASANCANRMFQHVLDNPVEKKEAVVV